jgi:hypothetical protein
MLQKRGAVTSYTDIENCFTIPKGIINWETMVFNYLPTCCGIYVVLSAVMWLFTGYAYWVNSKRLPSDPQKKTYNFNAIFLAPISWPLLLISGIIILIARSLLFGVFLVLFTLALIFVRKPFWLVWLDKMATWTGEKLLGANTTLIKFATGKSLSPSR